LYYLSEFFVFLAIIYNFAANFEWEITVTANMDKEQSYSQSISKLDALLSEIESNRLDVDELSEKVKLATELIKFCKEKLYSTEKDIRQIIDSEKQE
jgi:exodeoxyribonuclease VII small subunit